MGELVTFVPASAIAVASLVWTNSARAEDEPGPPPTSTHYLHYGVAVVANTVPSAGDVCPSDSKQPCILGTGLGLAIRIGYRSRGPWYVGGAYEFSRQDASNLLELPILQQLRAETRHYFDMATRLTPFIDGGLGAVLYGNEWRAETFGVTPFLGAGLEFQISETAVISPALCYRPMLLRGWTDSAGQKRADRYLGFGFAHIVAIEIAVEIRNPLPRW